MSDTYLSADDVQGYLNSSPFIRFLGLQLDEADPERGELVLRMPLKKELERGGAAGQFHGGPIASLIDTAGDFALIQTVKGPVPTINMRVDYLRPGSGSFLRAKAKVRRAGKAVGVVDVDVYDDQERLCAVGRGSYGMAIG